VLAAGHTKADARIDDDHLEDGIDEGGLPRGRVVGRK
jgi:hypothetical protein